MKTPISYYGGKQKMLKHILPLIPEHKTYCEPFFGGGSIYFNKSESQVEIINDQNNEVINFYQILKNHYNELEKEIQTSLHSRELHRRAKVIYENPELFDDIKRAWAFWMLTNQGFSNIIGKGWGYDKHGTCTRRIKTKIDNFTQDLSKRLQNTQIECNDALKVIPVYDTPDTFFYCDPPYFNSDCGHYKGYSKQDFINLLEQLSQIKGKFLLSSYKSDILEQFINRNGWTTQKIDMPVSVTFRSKKRKIEQLTMNYNS